MYAKRCKKEMLTKRCLNDRINLFQRMEMYTAIKSSKTEKTLQEVVHL